MSDAWESMDAWDRRIALDGVGGLGDEDVCMCINMEWEWIPDEIKIVLVFGNKPLDIGNL